MTCLVRISKERPPCLQNSKVLTINDAPYTTFLRAATSPRFLRGLQDLRGHLCRPVSSWVCRVILVFFKKFTLEHSTPIYFYLRLSLCEAGRVTAYSKLIHLIINLWMTCLREKGLLGQCVAMLKNHVVS